MRWALGVVVGVTVLTGLFVAWLVLPIVTAAPQGSSGQELGVSGFPTSVSAIGDDGRTRVLNATLQTTDGRGLDRLIAGDRIIVSGSGYNPDSGIYVAVCALPATVDLKPGPCLGGVPETTPNSSSIAGVVEYGPSNWINDQWAWRLFGARSFDNRDTGEFTAYIEVPGSRDDLVNCQEVRCGLYTRNDHTSLEDRVQDLYIPVGFVG
jgi:hypothetical protein